jgi:hypothetical protein
LQDYLGDGGLYLHYLLDEPLILTEQASRGGYHHRRSHGDRPNVLQTKGWALDNVSDLARITRPVGTRDWKYDGLRVVELCQKRRNALQSLTTKC